MMKNNVTPELKILLTSQTQAHTLEECWMEGYATAQAEGEYERNPFQTKSRESRFWEEGFMAGLYNEPPLFPEHAVDVNLHHEATTSAQNEAQPKWKTLLKSGKFAAFGAAITACGVAIFAVELIELAAA